MKYGHKLTFRIVTIEILLYAVLVYLVCLSLSLALFSIVLIQPMLHICWFILSVFPS